MLKVVFAGVVLIALGLICLNLRIEMGALALLAGAVLVVVSTIAGLSAGGKKAEKRWFR